MSFILSMAASTLSDCDHRISSRCTRLSLLIACSLLLVSCAETTTPGRIPLETPASSEGVRHPERLASGTRALEGSPWNSPHAAVFYNRGYVVFDLGEPTSVASIYIQGDNNDEFIVELSNDGRSFEEIWRAERVPEQGLRGRASPELEGRGRFVRLRARGGDASVSVAEFQLFETKPSTWPPRVPWKIHWHEQLIAQVALFVLAAFVALVVLFHGFGNKWWWRVAWAAASILAAMAIASLVRAWPASVATIDQLRAVSAAVSLCVVLRLGFWVGRASRRALMLILGFSALASVLTFYNLGRPQFFNHERGKPSYVHTWDMRVYFPTAKYFDELGYDGVYLASLAAYAEDVLDGSPAMIGAQTFRDLRTYEITDVRSERESIRRVKERFTPERWAEFKRDMAFFRRSMGGRGYLDTLGDHGGNATPVWLLAASALLGRAQASESTFLLSALLDPLLLLTFLVVAWRTFGPRAALVCMVVFGATTFPMFGSNWGGSTLRNDWMVLLGLGVCALQRRRWILGGVLLSWSAMIRAFPATALAFLAVPAVWSLWQHRRDAKAGEGLTQGQPPAYGAVWRVALGAVLTVSILFVASGSVLGWQESWGDWAEKVTMHADKPNVNHVGLLTLAGYDPDHTFGAIRSRGEAPERWIPLQLETRAQRRWLTAAAMLLFTLLAILATKGARLSDAALVGTLMIPIYFYPANYYLHCIFLWPLLLAGREPPYGNRHWTVGAAAVLLVCVLQYFGSEGYLRYTEWSGLLVGLIAVLLLVVIRFRPAPSRSGVSEHALQIEHLSDSPSR